MNTLRGVFPEPKKPPKRNFLKENMASIKQKEMAIKAFKTGYLQGVGDQNVSNKRKPKSAGDSKRNNKVITAEKPKMITVDYTQQNSARKMENTCCRAAVETALKNAVNHHKNKCKDMAVQTELSPKRHEVTSHMSSQQENPVLLVHTKQKSPKQQQQQQQQPPPETQRDEFSPGKKDFVKENAQIIKTIAAANKAAGNKSQWNPGNPPPDYKRGVVPKYIKDRKAELYKQAKTTEGDEKCPEGHVMLPDTERKDTLRMLRQSYAELITELNNLPVRSDTLKIRNRKMEIEKQLEKLDEGIKVFSRPKVFVKIVGM